MGLLARQDKIEQNRRLHEDRTKELQEFVARDTQLHGNNQFIKRSDFLRSEREGRERNAERHYQRRLADEQQARSAAAQAAELDSKLAAGLEAQRKARERTEREVKMIAKSSEELRWLEEALRAAEMNKERKLQIEEKQMLKAREEAYNQSYEALMEMDRREGLEVDALKAQERRQRQLDARRVLEQQMQEKEAMQEQSRIEYERERDAVDEVVRKIQAEDDASLQRKMDKQDETKAYISHFLEEQKHFKSLEQARLDDENARIQAHADEIERRTAAAEAHKAAAEAHKEKIQSVLGQQAEQDRLRREEMENLLNMLHFEEEENRLREKAEANAQKKARMVEEMRQANAYQKELKEKRAAYEREQEEIFRQNMLAKFKEDDRIEEMNAQRRREKMEEHKREVERLKAHKEQMYLAQREHEAAEHRMAAERQSYVDSIVEDERKRLLREKAAALKDFLPKGVLKRLEDLELLKGGQ
jgi:hypothetical protein